MLSYTNLIRLQAACDTYQVLNMAYLNNKIKWQNGAYSRQIMADFEAYLAAPSWKLYILF